MPKDCHVILPDYAFRLCFPFHTFFHAKKCGGNWDEEAKDVALRQSSTSLVHAVSSAEFSAHRRERACGAGGRRPAIGEAGPLVDARALVGADVRVQRLSSVHAALHAPIADLCGSVGNSKKGGPPKEKGTIDDTPHTCTCARSVQQSIVTAETRAY